MSYDVYAGILKMMDEFQNMNLPINFKYSYDNTALKRLEDKYHIFEIAGTGSTLSKAMNLLDWLSSSTYYYGQYDNHITNNALDLLEYSYGKGSENGINCRALSTILTECYLAIGLKARSIYLMPFSPYDSDNHVVCEVFIPENNKWIMVDPTYNGYIMNKNDDIYSALGLRHALADRTEIKLCGKFNYNGDYNIDFNDIKTYYAKDMFYFRCRENHDYNSEQLNDNRVIIFAPKGYDVKKSMITNIDYRIENFGYGKWIQDRKNSIEKDVMVYADKSELEKAPL